MDEYTQNREILLSGVPEGTGIIVWEWPFLLGLGLGAANGCIECTTATTQAVFCSNDTPSKKWWFSFRTIHNYICCSKIPLKSLNTFGTVLEPFFNVEQGYLDVGRTVTMQLVSVQDIISRWSEGVLAFCLICEKIENHVPGKGEKKIRTNLNSAHNYHFTGNYVDIVMVGLVAAIGARDTKREIVSKQSSMGLSVTLEQIIFQFGHLGSLPNKRCRRCHYKTDRPANHII